MTQTVLWADMTDQFKKSGNTYFIMRHGEAENNAKNIASCDLTRNHLTEKGRTEVALAAESLKNRGIDSIYTSPLVRTKETAEIVANVLGLNSAAIIMDERLHELNMGSLSEKPFAEYLAYRDAHTPTLTEIFPEGESYQDAKRRFGSFLYDIDQAVHNKTILIVTHGAGIESLLTVAQGGDMSFLRELVRTNEFKTAEVRKLDFTPMPHNEDYEFDSN